MSRLLRLTSGCGRCGDRAGYVAVTLWACTARIPSSNVGLRLVAGFPLRRPGFDSGRSVMGLVMENLAVWQVSVSTVGIIPPSLRVGILFLYYRRCITGVATACFRAGSSSGMSLVRILQFSCTKNNIRVVYMHTRLTVNGVLKGFLRKVKSWLAQFNVW